MPDRVLREQKNEVNQAIILIHPAMSQTPFLNWIKAEHHLNKLKIISVKDNAAVKTDRMKKKIHILDVISGYLQLFQIQIYKQPQALRISDSLFFFKHDGLN